MPIINFDPKKPKNQMIEEIRAEFNKIRELIKARDAESTACQVVRRYIHMEFRILEKEYDQRFPQFPRSTEDHAKTRAFRMVTQKLEQDLLAIYKEQIEFDALKRLYSTADFAIWEPILIDCINTASQYTEEQFKEANLRLETEQLDALKVKTIDEFSQEARFKINELRIKVAEKSYNPFVVTDYKPIATPSAMKTLLDALANQTKEIENLRKEFADFKAQVKDQKTTQTLGAQPIRGLQTTPFFKKP